MKKVLLTSLAALFVVGAANAGAYVTGGLAYETKGEGVTIPVSVGYAFSNGFRAEVDVFTTTDLSNTKDSFGAGVGGIDAGPGDGIGIYGVKGLYDLKAAKGANVYVGFGVNTLSYITTDALDVYTFKGLVVAGVSYDLAGNFALDLQYNRQFSISRVADDNDAEWKTSGNNIVKAGITYKF